MVVFDKEMPPARMLRLSEQRIQMFAFGNEILQEDIVFHCPRQDFSVASCFMNLNPSDGGSSPAAGQQLLLRLGSDPDAHDPAPQNQGEK